MARDYAARRPVLSAARSTLLAAVAAAILLAAQGVDSQKVRVEEKLEAYPTESVDLRCEFIDGGGRTKLTQLSWIWEPTDGQRDNIAVYHPTYGKSFPNPSFKDRVVFLTNSLENPSIRISNLKMSDEGRYTCEYATYPSGNEQATTELIMLAKPKNSAQVLTVQAGSQPVVVARCEAAEAKPAASITWHSPWGGGGGGHGGAGAGNHSSSSTVEGPDGTSTVRSEYRLAPAPSDNGRELSCTVRQRTQDHDWARSVRLSVEYPPSVSIEGYDENWYVGRSDAVLLCLANANPEPTTITWTAASGSLPDTVVVDGNKLTVRKVDGAVNTTFICEVKNKHGASRNQITTSVIEQERQVVPGPSSGAVIGGILGALVFIGIVVGVVFFIRKRREDADGPPKHKPPPPVKAGSSTEMLNKPSEPPTVTETIPLSPGEVYYEPTGEPVTNLDEETGGALNGGVLDETDKYDNVNELKDHAPLDGHHGNSLDTPPANITRGESFVSSPMYV